MLTSLSTGFGIQAAGLLRCGSSSRSDSCAFRLRRNTRHRFAAQFLEDRPAQPDHDEHERRRGYDGRRLQAFETPGQKTDRRGGTREHSPDDDDQAPGIQDAPGGQHAHHHRSRVGPADEEKRDQYDGQQRHDRCQRELVQGGKQGYLGSFAHGVCDVPDPVELQVDGRPSEDGEPDEADHARDQEHPDDELPDGAAPGDPGYECAHERGPGDPPRPVEDGPAGQPRVAAEGPRPEAHRDEVRQVTAERLDEGVEDKDRRPQDEQKHEQNYGQNHVGVGEPLDPAVHPRDRRDDEQRRHDGDDENRHRDRIRYVPHIIQPAVDLQGTQSQRGGRAEQGGEDRQDVYGLARRAFDPVSQKRTKRRADQVRPALAEGEVGEGETHHGIHRPRVQRPVEVGVLHRHLGGLLRTGLRQTVRGSGEVRDGLRNPVEHQPDPHSRAEHHGYPRRRAELRLIVVFAQLDPAVAGKGQEDHERQKAKRRQYEHPAKVCYQPAQDRRSDRGQVVREEHTPQHEQHRDNQRDPEHARIYRRAYTSTHNRSPSPLSSPSTNSALLKLTGDNRTLP